jgi:delta-aminolevulinic acid dehydratase/porphobilinogen synthase
MKYIQVTVKTNNVIYYVSGKYNITQDESKMLVLQDEKRIKEIVENIERVFSKDVHIIEIKELKK